MLYTIKKNYKKVVIAAFAVAFVAAIVSIIADYDISRYSSAIAVFFMAIGISADILGVHATREIRRKEKEPKVRFITLD